MMKWLCFLSLLVFDSLLINAQVPGFGGCPDFESYQDFDMNKFLGTWYEAERYVNIFEAGTRCVRTNYTKAVDGRFLVANEIMNRFTSIKRVLEGEIRLVVKGSESKLNVKYPNLPIPYESQLMVLDTDYDSFAVMWSCSSLGILNAQNAWILTREKLSPGTVLQKAYGVLDKYKLSRTFFVKTDQNSCEIAEAEHAATTTNKDKLTNQKKEGVAAPAAGSAPPPPPPKKGIFHHHRVSTATAVVPNHQQPEATNSAAAVRSTHEEVVVVKDSPKEEPAAAAALSSTSSAPSVQEQQSV